MMNVSDLLIFPLAPKDSFHLFCEHLQHGFARIHDSDHHVIIITVRMLTLALSSKHSCAQVQIYNIG